MEGLTAKQRDTLRKFREQVADVLQPKHDDYFLLRWLKARNFDIKKADVMLRNSLEWRANYGADTILKDWEPPIILKHYWPGGVYGFDKEGHPVLWQISKDFDSKAMMKSVKKSDIVKYHIHRMEHLMYLCEVETQRTGRKITSSLHISDLDGFSLSQVFAPGISDTMKHIFALYEANYPENVYKSYVINGGVIKIQNEALGFDFAGLAFAPAVFAVFFNILRPFLSEDTKKKIHILGKNWQSEIYEMIDKDQIPSYWGGTATDSDDVNNTSHINYVRPVPEEYFKENVTLDRTNMTCVTVQRNTTHSVEFEVVEPGTVLRWLFETDTNDIGFGVFRYPEGKEKSRDNLDEIIPTTRLNTQQVPEEGNIRCNKTGVYVIRFDNTYSWMNSKVVYYEIEMMTPDKDPVLFWNMDREDNPDGVVIETTHL